MLLINLKKLARSFSYACHGLKQVLVHEQNFRIQIFFALLVVALMIFFTVKLWEAVVLIMLIFSVLILEILNTIFERLTDFLKPQIHYYVKVIKDLMAAAVLLASIGAVIISFIILGPYIWSLFTC